MRNTLSWLISSLCIVYITSTASWAQSGPTQASNVFTLPNEAVTPNWKSNKTYVPKNCRRSPDACADDHRFWEEWNFSNDFGPGASFNAINASFAAVAADSTASYQGRYQTVMLLMPLTDAGYFRSNFTVMHQYSMTHGVALQPVLFPKWKYGAEWCYLYRTPPPNDANVANNCQLDSSTGQTLAFEKLVSVMDFTQGLVGCTNPGTTPSPGFAIWYGWSTSEFPEQTTQNYPGEILENFWQSLPTGGTLSSCNLQAAYITWLDTGYTNNADVPALQSYVKSKGGLQWVNTELYSDSQILAGYNLYAPYQTVITGYWDAPDITSWARGMCSKWSEASHPPQLGAWTFYDRDVDSPYELYRSYINNQMAVVGSICSY